MTGDPDRLDRSVRRGPARAVGSALLGVLLAVLLQPAGRSEGLARPAADEWRPIFDGRTLEGWKAPDMSYCSVEDGAITGTTARDHNPPENQFIVWQGGEVADFDLRFEFRIFGAKANSGMQFRSQVRERGLVYGYQADITADGPYLGGIWDEYGPRKSLASRGERVASDPEGRRTGTRFADPGELVKGIDVSQWNEYRVTARGPHIVLRINGKVTAELTDREAGKAAASGVLAMPVIPTEMKVQYRDLRLNNLAN